MTCVNCGHGTMQERETGSSITAECHACGARVRAVVAPTRDAFGLVGSNGNEVWAFWKER